jgi:plastocyanin
MSRISVVITALLAAAGFSVAVQIPVSIVDFAFSPDSVQLNPGDSVKWTNNGTYTHTSTSGVNGVWDSLWDSGNLANGATYVHGFPAGGKFRYFCRHHANMKGVVVVGTTGVSETPGKTATGLASFPNPFRAGTSIRFAPSGSAAGCVRVFDALGKLVRTLPAARATSVTWDGRDSRGQEAGPGVYLCRFGSGVLAVTRLR